MEPLADPLPGRDGPPAPQEAPTVSPALLADLQVESTVNPEFALLACMSAVIATFGLLADALP
jgi:hypothetical protein